MAKDPAVLFYTSDFLTGVRRMTYEQVGKYITLLCMQHQYGSLTEKDMIHICGTYDEDIWVKFEKTDAGFINKRMHEEAEKRKRYSESRRNNKLNSTKKQDMSNISLSYDKHMENENENENEVVSINKIQKGKGFVKPELFQVQNYFEEVGALPEAEGFFNYYESNGWKVGKNPMKDWQAASRNWIKNSKNYKSHGTTTKSSSDIYAERRAELHKYAEQIDQLRGIRP
ncbi:Protein of unknown function DUF1376 [uncultured Caudovirales phage]|uniref:Lin1244/Lin1753-like N-terminal domain-containing protein n=1 Tax=uncultured Caudovirales phage TaxID=2100421 RepID=A0A6J5LSA6_9CAUD|nr:Protein of unknown function DUF1376 [uncultured Caudovirales phage]